MKALVRDRILGLDASGSQMGTYSPGNMLDDSTRNVWISSQYKDSITMECNTQVNSFFIGNVRSDDIRYSYFKKDITAISGQVENSSDYIHILLELDGDKTGNNRPFENGDHLRVRVSSDPNAHVESSAVIILQENYDKVTNKTRIFAKYPYDLPKTYATTQSIRNHIHGVEVIKGININDVLYTTFKFPTVNDKVRFTIMESEDPVESIIHTIFYDGASGTTTPQSLPSIPDQAQNMGTGTGGVQSNALTAFSSDNGFEQHPDYDGSTWNSNANNELNYKNNRWAVQEVTNALLAGATNYHPESSMGHFIRFTNIEGDPTFEALYFRLKSHASISGVWSGYSAYGSYNYTAPTINWPAYEDNWGGTSNMSTYNTSSNNFLYKVSGNTIVDGTQYNFQLGRAEMVLSVTGGVYNIGDQALFNWEQIGEVSGGSGYYELMATPEAHLNTTQLLEKDQTLYTQYKTGDELVSTNLLTPEGIILTKSGTRTPVLGDQVVLEVPPTIEFYQQDTSGEDIQDIKTATRFYRNLGDFVQGIFVDAVSVFVDVPYDDQPTKIEVKMTNQNDRRLNKAMYWFKDETEGSIVDVALTTPPSLSGTDGKLTIAEGSDHNLSVGDVFNLKHINHDPSTTGEGWAGDRMPGWYDEFDFNGEHIVTEVVDNTTYKSEKVIAPFSTVSQPWTSDIQRYRNQANDAWLNIHSDRGGVTRGRLTETPVDIQSITYGNGTAQVSYSNPHGLVDGDLIIISGASSSVFNSTHQVLYVSSYTVAISYNTSDLGSSGTETSNLQSYKPIDLTDFGVIKVGSHLLFSNSDSIIESSQILSIRGTGTSQGDLKVRGDFPSTSLAKIYTPIFGGIVKAGYSFEFPNAQVGLQYNTKDYSIKKELTTGAYHYLNRVTAKEFSGNMLASPNEADRIVEFAKQQMGSPFAVNVLSNMNLNTTTSFYAYFTTPPSVSFSNRMDNQRDVSFALKEVL